MFGIRKKAWIRYSHPLSHCLGKQKWKIGAQMCCEMRCTEVLCIVFFFFRMEKIWPGYGCDICRKHGAGHSLLYIASATLGRRYRRFCSVRRVYRPYNWARFGLSVLGSEGILIWRVHISACEVNIGRWLFSFRSEPSTLSYDSISCFVLTLISPKIRKDR